MIDFDTNLRVLSPKNGTSLESGYRVQTCDCNKWMRYIEYIGEIHFFLPISAFFRNHGDVLDQNKKIPDDSIQGEYVSKWQKSKNCTTNKI